MPELATLLAFLFLAALLVYVILQVPLATEDRSVIDLRDGPHQRDRRPVWFRRSPATTFLARLVFIDAGQRTITVDGIALASGEPFALEVARPDGWTPEAADGQLLAWAARNAVLHVRLHEDLRGRRASLTAGEATMDLPVAGVLGVPSFAR